MEVYDFEYDGVRLSDIGYTICNFNGKDLNTISNGSQITFNTVSVLGGIKQFRTSAEYNDALTTTFQICKNNCGENEDLRISVPELRDINRWLNRKQFHKLKLISDEFAGLWWNGSFNVSRIELNDALVGLELDLITDAPFAWMEEREIHIANADQDGEFQIVDYSDEEGFLYPYMEIKLNASGDLSIYNSAEDRETIILNCNEGEVITLDSPIITTTDESHEIQNDFNWNFFRISNKQYNRENNLVISLPCDITIKYYPIAKMGL